MNIQTLRVLAWYTHRHKQYDLIEWFKQNYTEFTDELIEEMIMFAETTTDDDWLYV